MIKRLVKKAWETYVKCSLHGLTKFCFSEQSQRAISNHETIIRTELTCKKIPL